MAKGAPQIALVTHILAGGAAQFVFAAGAIAKEIEQNTSEAK